MVEVTVTLLRYYKKFWVPETRSYGFKVLDISFKYIPGNGNKNWGISKVKHMYYHRQKVTILFSLKVYMYI